MWRLILLSIVLFNINSIWCDNVEDIKCEKDDQNPCPIGQKLGCGDNCNRKCSNFFKGTSSIECVRLPCRNLTCQCDPEQDYYYDPTKQACVPSSECPKEVTTALTVDDTTVTPQIQCGINEEYSNCTEIICRAQKCEEKGKSVACPGITPGSCSKGCVCKVNFLKGSNNSCVPQEECPTDNILDDFKGSCPVGQKLGCGNNCNRKCRNYYHGTSPIECPSYQCTNLTCQCDPEQDYYYDPSRQACVPSSECPKEVTTALPVDDTTVTPQIQCGINEEYSNCTEIICRAQKCEEKGKSVACPGITPGSCSKGCVCKVNFLKGSNNSCVPQEECPTDNILDDFKGSCPVGQKLGCGNNCNRKCRNYYHGTSPIECPSYQCTNLTCQCDPEQDYYYDPSRQACVPSSECPKEVTTALPVDDTTVTPQIQCGINEEYSNCTEIICRAQKCEEKGKSVACPGITPGSCSKGCVCKVNFLKGSNNSCVPQEECPTDNILDDFRGSCPVGQKLGCGNNCNRKCRNYYHGTSRFECPRYQCTTLTCQCDPSQGYYYHPTRNTCVPASECPKDDDTTTSSPR